MACFVNMLKLHRLLVILFTSSLPGISDQAALSCERSEIELMYVAVQDPRVVDGFPRTSREDPIFLGSAQNLTVIRQGNFFTENVGVCYSTSPNGCYRAEFDLDECDNFLRGVTALGNDCTSGNCRVLACGTNAFLPRCSFCIYNGSELDCSNFVENVPEQNLPYNGTSYSSCTSENVNGEEVFQIEKNENATFLYDNDTLFYGAVRSRNDPDSIIGLASIDTNTGMISGNVITRVDSEKMVAAGAHFVGMPFVHADFAYFLFREPALEVASLSNGQDQEINTYYSRIARICRNDAGTTVSSTQILTSYLKQRLVCCLMENNECSVELNDIQDFVYNETSGVIHAIFTNELNDFPVSALCIFNLTVIDATFSTGSFFGASGSTTNDRWREYDGGVVEPRPGLNCSDPNTGQTNFLRDYNLMLDPAEQTKADPFYLEGDRFSNLEIDWDNNKYIISSEGGCLYQIDMDCSKTDLGGPCQDPVAADPIKDLELLPNGYLITTVNGVFNISNCTGVVAEPQTLSPEAGVLELRPNSYFEFITDTSVTGQPDIVCNGSLVTESNDRAYLVERNESLDTSGTLRFLRILILDECIVTFDEQPDLNYTIQTYQNYTIGELEQRCDAYDEAAEVRQYLIHPEQCGEENSTDPGGSFNSTYLLQRNQVKNCANCAYYGCTENTCTP